MLGWLVRVADDALDVRDPRGALLLPLWPVLADPEGSYTGMLAVLPGLILTWIVVTTAALCRPLVREPTFARPCSARGLAGAAVHHG